MSARAPSFTGYTPASRTVASERPALILQLAVQRGRLLRRMLGALFTAGVGAFVFWGLGLPEVQAGLPRWGWLAAETARLVGLGLALAATVRAIEQLVYALRWRDERVRFLDRGFIWERPAATHKVAWSSLESYRDTSGGWYLRDRPIAQWGAHIFTLRDGRTYKLTPIFGDLRRAGYALRPLVAAEMGTRIAERLREDKPFRVHPRLILWPKGIEAGPHEIAWGNADVRLRGRTLQVRRRKKGGGFRTVARYRASRVDNLPGVLDLTTSVIHNHQAGRFR